MIVIYCLSFLHPTILLNPASQAARPEPGHLLWFLRADEPDLQSLVDRSAAQAERLLLTRAGSRLNLRRGDLELRVPLDLDTLLPDDVRALALPNVPQVVCSAIKRNGGRLQVTARAFVTQWSVGGHVVESSVSSSGALSEALADTCRRASILTGRILQIAPDTNRAEIAWSEPLNAGRPTLLAVGRLLDDGRVDRLRRAYLQLAAPGEDAPTATGLLSATLRDLQSLRQRLSEDVPHVVWSILPSSSATCTLEFRDQKLKRPLEWVRVYASPLRYSTEPDDLRGVTGPDGCLALPDSPLGLWFVTCAHEDDLVAKFPLVPSQEAPRLEIPLTVPTPSPARIKLRTLLAAWRDGKSLYAARLQQANKLLNNDVLDQARSLIDELRAERNDALKRAQMEASVLSSSDPSLRDEVQERLQELCQDAQHDLATLAGLIGRIDDELQGRKMDAGARTLAERADQSRRELRIDEMLKLLDEAIAAARPGGKLRAQLAHRRNDYATKWTVRNPDHARARQFVFEILPGLDGARIVDKVDAVINNLKILQQVGDAFSCAKVMQLALDDRITKLAAEHPANVEAVNAAGAKILDELIRVNEIARQAVPSPAASAPSTAPFNR